MLRLIPSLVLSIVLSSTTMLAQVPKIISLSSSVGQPGDNLIINGVNFHQDPDSNVVFFGGLRALVLTADSVSLEAQVPVGATFDFITVRTVNGVSYSPRKFLPIYSGSGFVDTTSFYGTVSFLSGLNPGNSVVVDIDGDSWPDISATNNGNNTLSVLRSLSVTGQITSSSYDAKVSFGTGELPLGLAFGDLDTDGRPDLLVANRDSNSFSVFRNTATSGSFTAGSLAPKVSFATSAAPVGVAIHDFDGDGRPDVVSTNRMGHSISVFRNIGTSGFITNGTFDTRADYSTGANSFPHGITVGDIDGDAKADLMVANSSSQTISIFRNTSVTGSITFAARLDFSTSPFGGPEMIAFGDLNNDGAPDMAVPNYAGGKVSLFRNTSSTGAISFSPRVDISTQGLYPIFVAISDADGDSKPDLFVANYLNSSISLFKNFSAGNLDSAAFPFRLNFPTQSLPASIVPADVNRDNQPDLIIGYGSGTLLSIMENDVKGAPVFSASPSVLEFGAVLTGESKLDTAIVSNFGESALKIFGVSHSRPEFTLLPNSVEIGPSGSFGFQISFAPTDTGEFIDTALFFHNGGVAPSSIILKGVGVSPGFAVSTDSIEFGAVPVGRVLLDSFVVSNPGSANLAVAISTGGNMNFSVEPAFMVVLPDSQKTVVVSFDPEAPGSIVGRLYFTHNAPGFSDSVFLEGVSVESILAFDRERVNMSTVLVGNTKTDSLKVTNTGSVVVTIGGVITDNSVFEISNDSAKLEPGETIAFAIDFTPTTSGWAFARMIFLHDGGGSPDTVIVAGSGVPVNSISGINFNDENRDGLRDSDEPGLPGWKILLKKVSLTSLGSSTLVDSTNTDSTGTYLFSGMANGIYEVSEEQQDGWIQTYPPRSGTHLLVVAAEQSYSSVDFGNVFGYQYVGPSVGNWSDSTVWTGGRPPAPGDAVVIPNGVRVIVDALVADSIAGLRVQHGGILSFAANQRLIVDGNMQIDSNATLEFPDDANVGLRCRRDWINRGTFIPGRSTIRFVGNRPKTIFNAPSATGLTSLAKGAADFQGVVFYNLEISGDSTEVNGNIQVTNQLVLNGDLVPRQQDTVVISSGLSDAMAGSGVIPKGTVQRVIELGSTSQYRFESEASYIQFSGGTTETPSSVMIETSPADTSARAFGLYWEPIASEVDTATNTVRAENVSKFSKWTLGKPGPGFSLKRAGKFTTLVQAGDVYRVYNVHPEGGSNYTATLSLRYEEEELSPGTGEDTLTLYHGPYLVGDVSAGWNLLSLPVRPDTATVSSVFPSTISDAYRFTSEGYQTASELDPGAGYWLKFGSPEQVAILGDDFERISIPVTSGWNLIGSPTYPVNLETVTSEPSNIIETSFFEYRGGYEIADSLVPLKGYWVKVNADGELILDASTTESASTSRSSGFLPDKLNELIVRDSRGYSQTLYFGFEVKGDRRAYQMPPLPPAEMLDVRFEGGFAAAFLSPSGSTSASLEIRSAVYPLTIEWKTGENDKRALAFLTAGTTKHALSGRGKLRVEHPEDLSLVLESDGGSTLPSVFALHQSYPNPFNPSAVIGFDLVSESHVTLKVYDILGREVAILSDGKLLPAGIHQVTFDASSLASGMYVYRLFVTDERKSPIFFDAKRMILLK